MLHVLIDKDGIPSRIDRGMKLTRSGRLLVRLGLEAQTGGLELAADVRAHPLNQPRSGRSGPSPG